MSWLIFTVLAINFWCVSNIIDKNVMSKRVKSPVVPVVMDGLSGIVFAFLAFLVLGGGFNYSGMLLGFSWIVILFLYYKAMQLEEASRVVALYNIIPIFVAILAYIILGERFGAETYAGILLIVFGAVLVSVDRRFRLSKALLIMVLFAAVYAAYSIGLKYAIGVHGFPSVFYSFEMGIFLGGIAIWLLRKKEFAFPQRRTVSMIIASQVFGVAGMFTLMYAVSLGPISLISAVENTQSVFLLVYTTALSIAKPHIIKESISRRTLLQKSAAILVMVAGAVMVGG